MRSSVRPTRFQRTAEAEHIRVWGNLETRVAWDHEIVGSNPTTRTFNNKGQDTARSFNGQGRRPDKVETKVRLLLGLFGTHKDNTRSLKCGCIVGNKYPRPTRGRGVTAAQQTFNLHGEGSNPSDLTERHESLGRHILQSRRAASRSRY